MNFPTRTFVAISCAVASVEFVAARSFSDEYLNLRRMVGRCEYEESSARCSVLIAQYPREGVLYDALAEIGQYSGRMDEARAFLWRRVEDGRGLALCYFGLGNLSYRQEDDRAAIFFLSKAIELGTEVPECYAYFAYAYERLEGVDATLRLFTALCHRHPMKANYWYGLALAYWGRSDLPNALMCMKEAAGLDPEEPLYQEACAVIRLKAGKGTIGAGDISILAELALKRDDISRHCFLLAQLVQESFKDSDFRRADSIANCIVRTATQYGYKRWAGWGYQHIGQAAFLRGEYESALLSLQSALPEALRAGDRDLAASILSCMFEVHSERGDFYPACAIAQRRLESASTSPRSRAFVQSMNDMASVLNSIGLYRLALDFAVEGLSMADQLSLDGHMRCELNTNVGMIHLNLGDFRTARRHLKIADDLVRDEPYFNKVKSVTVGNLGELELACGRLPEAERCFRLQKVLATRGRFGRQIASALMNLGALEETRGRLVSATRLLRDAYEQAAQLELMPIVTQSIVRMAQIHKRTGEEARAIAWYRVLDSLSYAKRRLGWYLGDWSLNAWRATGIRDHASLLARAGKTIDAWRVGETLAQERSWSFIAGAIGRHDSSVSSPGAWKTRGIFEYGQSVASRRPNGVTAPTDLQMLIARSGVVTAELSRRAQFAERLGRSRLFSRELANTEFTAQVQTILQKEAVLIQYLVGKEHTLVVCVSQDTIVARQLHLGEAQLKDFMARISPVFSPSGQGSSIWNAAMADFDIAATAALTDSIWSPFLDVIRDHAVIYVVPDGPLAALPLEILVAGDEVSSSGEAFADLNFLVLDRAFSYQPSTSALMASEYFDSPGFQGTMIGLGDPLTAVSRTRIHPSVDVPEIRLPGPRLPKSRTEIRSLERINGSEFEGKIGFEANEGILREAISSARIVHVAAHGSLDREIPFLSKISLAEDSVRGDDGSFHTFEFATINSPAPVLILSGCNTLAVSGVANNFRETADIRTGPAGVFVGSLWNVNDHVTASLMTKLHQRLAEGTDLIQALQLAKKDLIREGISDPFEWGAFIAVGRLPRSASLSASTDTRLTRGVLLAALLFVVAVVATMAMCGRDVRVILRGGRTSAESPSLQCKWRRGE